MASKLNIIFGIVTYKEKFWECESFLSLKYSFERSGLDVGTILHVYVVDNTDLPDWHLGPPSESDNIKVTYVNLPNPGISAAYNIINNFALTNNFDWVVFLDQDTLLPANFFSVYNSKAIANNLSAPINIPAVYAGEKLISPALYKNYRSYMLHTLKKEIELDDISFINSGLMINTSFFKEVGGYNENLRLDFCDHDFVERIKIKSNIATVLNINLQQDFSAETHNIGQAITRYKMFTSDLQEFYQTRNFIKVLLFVDLPHLLKLTYRYLTLKFVIIRFST